MEEGVPVSKEQLLREADEAEASNDEAKFVSCMAQIVEACMSSGKFSEAAKHMQRTIDFERARKKFISMVNLEMDLVEILRECGKKKSAGLLKKQILKDREECFSVEEKSCQAQRIDEAIAQSVVCESYSDTLDVLESCFQSARAMLGDEHEQVQRVRREMAKVYFDDANFDDCLRELEEVSCPDFETLRLMLECQRCVEDWDGCFETLRVMKEEHAAHNEALREEVEQLTAATLSRAGKWKEASIMYGRMRQRPFSLTSTSDNNEEEEEGKKKEKSLRARVTMLSQYGRVLMELQQLDDALGCCHEALDLINKTKQQQKKKEEEEKKSSFFFPRSMEAGVMFLQCKVMFKMRRYDECLKQLEQMHETLKKKEETKETKEEEEEEQDDEGIVNCLVLQATVMVELKRNDDALSTLQQCVEMCKKKGEDLERTLLQVYDTMGMIYHAMGNEEMTLKYYELAHPQEQDDE